MKEKLKIVKERPTDWTHPGFKLPGFKLRWIGDKHHETAGGDAARIWRRLLVTDLPDDFVQEWRRTNPESHVGGNTIRKGDLVLHYAPVDVVEQHKAYLAELRNKQREADVVLKGDGLSAKAERTQYIEGPEAFE